MRGLKMGGKGEKRGACRSESLIIYRPKNHAKKCGEHHSITIITTQNSVGKKSDVEQMRRMDRSVDKVK